MLKFNNSEIVSVGKKLRHKILFDIPEEIDYLKLFKNKFLKEQLITSITDNSIYKKHK